MYKYKLTEKDIILAIDDSFEGLLCAVFYCFKTKTMPINIIENDKLQLNMVFEYKIIKTDYEKAYRVAKSIKNNIKGYVYQNAYKAFLNPDENRLIKILKYICLAFNVGKNVDNYKTKPYVLDVLKMSRHAKGEAHLFLGFIRFIKTKENIYYCKIEPECDVLVLISHHFQDRLKNEKWIIHDMKRKKAAVYNGSSFIITDINFNINIEKADDEKFYTNLWKEFYKTISVENRENPKLKRNMMPKKYRKYMTGFDNIENYD